MPLQPGTMQATHLRLDSSSSPLMGNRPPSNTTTGSSPFVRSSCMREMKYTTNLNTFKGNRVRTAQACCHSQVGTQVGHTLGDCQLLLEAKG